MARHVNLYVRLSPPEEIAAKADRFRTVIPAVGSLGNLLKPSQAAELLGAKIGLLSSWRLQGTGPSYCLIEGGIRYNLDELVGFAERRREWLEKMASEQPAETDEISEPIQSPPELTQMIPATDLKGILRTRDLAERLDISIGTVLNWRYMGKGPRYFKLGSGQSGHVRYRLEDVIAWENDLIRVVPNTTRENAIAAAERISEGRARTTNKPKAPPDRFALPRPGARYR